MRYRQDTVSFMRQHRRTSSPLWKTGKTLSDTALVWHRSLPARLCVLSARSVATGAYSTIADCIHLLISCNHRMAHGQGNRSRLL